MCPQMFFMYFFREEQALFAEMEQEHEQALPAMPLWGPPLWVWLEVQQGSVELLGGSQPSACLAF